MSGQWQGYGLRYGPISTAATDENGWYGIHFVGFGDSALKQVEWQPAYGFAARPVDGTSKEACNGFYSLDGEFAWCGHDARYSDRAPPFNQGASAQWNCLGAFVLQDPTTATTTIYQPNAGRTKAHKILIGVDGNDVPTIDILHSSGACLTITDTEAMLRHSGNAYVEVKGSDINLNGSVNAPTGLSVGGAAAQSVPLMPQLLSYLQALELLLTAMATTIDAKLVVTAGATVATVQAFIGASAGLKTAMQSQMLKGL
jgi:hypothetical protein